MYNLTSQSPAVNSHPNYQLSFHQSTDSLLRLNEAASDKKQAIHEYSYNQNTLSARSLQPNLKKQMKGLRLVSQKKLFSKIDKQQFVQSNMLRWEEQQIQQLVQLKNENQQLLRQLMQSQNSQKQLEFQLFMSTSNSSLKNSMTDHENHREAHQVISELKAKLITVLQQNYQLKEQLKKQAFTPAKNPTDKCQHQLQHYHSMLLQKQQQLHHLQKALSQKQHIINSIKFEHETIHINNASTVEKLVMELNKLLQEKDRNLVEGIKSKDRIEECRFQIEERQRENCELKETVKQLKEEVRQKTSDVKFFIKLSEQLDELYQTALSQMEQPSKNVRKSHTSTLLQVKQLRAQINDYKLKVNSLEEGIQKISLKLKDISLQHHQLLQTVNQDISKLELFQQCMGPSIITSLK